MASQDPYRGFNFHVEIDGISEAGFQECAGLDATTDPVEYREGTDPNHVRHLTGLNKYSPITLKRGITDSASLWTWRKTVINGTTQRKNVSIVLYDEAQQEKLRWNLSKAWPSKWTGPSFNATSDEVAIESIEIVYDEMVKA